MEKHAIAHDERMMLTRRGMLLGAGALTLAPNAAGAVDVPQELPLFSADFAEERKTFRTRLITLGPAPDPYEPWATAANAETVTYRTGDKGELELRAWVSKVPSGGGRRPAVLFLHGGNATGLGHWELMTPYIEAGYVVMLPTFRGENGQAGAYTGFFSEVDDALAAAEWLAGHPAVDPNRMVLAGHSNGGTLSLLASLTTSRFRAAVPISGNPNTYSYFNRFPQNIRFDESDPREFQMRSAACYPGSFKCPILLLHAQEETNAQARLTFLMDRARKAGATMELETLPGGHNTGLPGEIVRSIAFFRPFIG